MTQAYWLQAVPSIRNTSPTVTCEEACDIRVQPDRVSIAAYVAIETICGHSAGLVQSKFYDSFATAARNIFNARNKAGHTRKRKMMAHGFALRPVQEFEPYRSLRRTWPRFFSNL